MYGVVSADFKDRKHDGGNEDVDEHRLHATVLEQLQHLKSTTTVSYIVSCCPCMFQPKLFFLAPCNHFLFRMHELSLMFSHKYPTPNWRACVHILTANKCEENTMGPDGGVMSALFLLDVPCGQEMENALAASRKANSAAELGRQQAQAQEAEWRNQMETRLSELRQEAAARDAAAQAEQGLLRDTFASQAQELAQALEDASHCREACTKAETTAQAAEDARRAAVVAASTAESNLGDVREDARLAKLETQSVKEQLAGARAALEASQDEMTRTHEAQDVAESKLQQLSDQVVELEKLLQDAHSRSSELESDLAESSHKVAELTQVTQVCQREVAEATAKSVELQAYVDTQEDRLRESLERVTELSDTLQTLRSGKTPQHLASPVNVSIPYSCFLLGT